MYSIWNESDFTGYEASTVKGCMEIIDSVIWWTGRMEIVNNNGVTVMTAIKTDASKGLKALKNL